MSVKSKLAAVLVGGTLLVAAAPPAGAISVSPDTSSVTNGRVESSVQAGSDLYIGGAFTTVDGAAHTGLAALNAASGILDASFNVSVNGEVASMAVSGNTLYIAGSFTTVGTVSRTNVAAIDLTTDSVLPFAATPSASVASIDVANGVAYIGGVFTAVNGTARPYLAALDATTGALISAFDPNPSAQVNVVKATGSSLYVGGNFQTIAGAARNYVAQLDLTGHALPWDASLGFDSRVINIAFDPIDPTAVYLTAGGHLPNGNSVYRIDAVTGLHLWQVQVDGDVHAIVVSDGTVYAGGHFDFLESCDSSGVCAAGAKRKKAVAINELTGQVLDWAPVFNSIQGIFNMNVAGGNFYAFGDFTTVNGTSHPHIARFTITTSSAPAPVATTGGASSVTTSGATVNGTVNPQGSDTTYYFEYGTDTSYGTTTTSGSAGAGTTTQSVSADLTGLTASTTYHYRLVATNASGTAYGSDATFTTLAGAAPPVVTTGGSSSVTSAGATVNGTVNPQASDTSYYFEYGPTTGYGTSTTPVSAGAGATAQNVSAALTGLAGSTTYHYRLVATNANGTTFGSDATFTTKAAPGANTGSATGITSTGATVKGTVNPHGSSTSYYFEYGTDTSYGTTTTPGSAGAGSTGVSGSAGVTGLAGSTTYHYRLVATNASGSTTYGSDRTFTPPAR
jgi:hypothetical protein